MELDALVLAEAITVTDEGKFFVHGGGFTRFDVPGLPAPIPIDVLIRLRVGDDDLKKDLRLNVALIGPQGIPNVEPIEVLAIPPKEVPDLAEGQEQFLQVGLTLPGIALRAGLYHVEFRLNGRLAKKVPLPVVVDERIGQEEREPAGDSPSTPSGQQRAKTRKKKRPSPPPRKKQKRQR